MFRTRPPSGANAAVTVLSWPCGAHRFCAGCDFLAATFQVSRADLHGFTPPSPATSISESGGRNLHTTTCWGFARPKALRDTALMTDDATNKLNAKA